MTSNMERAPLTTVVYVTGTTPTERADKARTVLAHAVDNCGEDWIARDPSFEGNATSMIDEFEERIQESDETNPGGNMLSEETDYRPPIHRIRIGYDAGPSRTGLTTIVNGVKSASGRHINVIMTHPDDVATRSDGVRPLQQLTSNGATVRFAESGVALTAGADISGATKRAVMTLSDAIHPTHDPNDSETYPHSGGRPPLGFEVQDGRLVESDDHAAICTRLQQVVDQRCSKNRAAEKLGCARGTIINAIEDRPEMYNLDV